MRLICPNCGAQYEVPAEVIPAEGRDVQCSNCGVTWFQGHPDAAQSEPEDAFEAEGAELAVAETEDALAQGVAADDYDEEYEDELGADALSEAIVAEPDDDVAPFDGEEYEDEGEAEADLGFDPADFDEAALDDAGLDDVTPALADDAAPEADEDLAEELADDPIADDADAAPYDDDLDDDVLDDGYDLGDFGAPDADPDPDDYALPTMRDDGPEADVEDWDEDLDDTPEAAAVRGDDGAFTAADYAALGLAAATVPEDEEAEDDLTPPAAAPRRSLDPDIQALLREEAEFEASARAREAEPLESQIDLGLGDPETPFEREQRESRERLLRARAATAGAGAGAVAATAARPSPPSPPPSAGDPLAEEVAPDHAAPRRDLLPDIEEINSSLRSKGDAPPGAAGTAADPAEQAREQRRGFRLGFGLILLLAAGLILYYMHSEWVARQVPALAGPTEAYVETANGLRRWLDGQAGELQQWLEGMSAAD
ncbi:zinc-ribbon domain-containing protein [Pseudooceanicola sp. LIPI14-2-Ac024]|uniref:zinc-ribbon domain-containing protein n=1 Tax=Pseudooceanicola sp. LIPI14-2-Ac024 TaxID=3344875 RepID=UPI0035D0A7DA